MSGRADRHVNEAVQDLLAEPGVQGALLGLEHGGGHRSAWGIASSPRKMTRGCLRMKSTARREATV